MVAADITPETLTILYTCEPSIRLLAFDVKDISTLLSTPTANVTLSPQYLLNISYQLTITHHDGYCATLIRLWDNRLALFLRAEGDLSMSPREDTDSAVYAILPLDPDSLKHSAGVGPLVAPAVFIQSFHILTSWDGNDLAMSGRGAKTTVFMRRSEDDRNQDTIRLCFFNLPGAKELPPPPLQHPPTSTFDETSASTPPVFTSSVGKMFEVDVPHDILGDGRILAIEVGELTGMVVFMVEDGRIIVMDCLPGLFGVTTRICV